jgi:pimeloyl-ACP methyl ester carboxylesterase
MSPERKGAYARANGLEMYYEVHGEGEPLILLHSGIGAVEMFGEVLPLLARDRLAILPGTTHYDIFNSPTLASTVAPFLDAPVAGAR